MALFDYARFRLVPLCTRSTAVWRPNYPTRSAYRPRRKLALVASAVTWLSLVEAPAAWAAPACAPPQRLTSNPRREISPAWDTRVGATTVAFVRAQPLPPASVPGDLFAVDADTGVERALATQPFACGFGIGATPAWVPGTALLLTEERCTFHEYMTFDTRLAPFVRTAFDGNDAAFVRKLFIPGGAGGGWIRVSRNGSTALWRHSTSGGSGFTTIRTAPYAALAGQSADTLGTVLQSTTTTTSQPQAFISAATLTPDGAQYLLSLPSGTGRDVFLYSTTGAGLIRQVTTTGGSIGASNTVVDVSPDGAHALISSNGPGTAPGGGADLFEIGLDGSGLVNLTETSSISEGGASYSPDGLRIAVSAVDLTAPAASRNEDVWVIDCSQRGDVDGDGFSSTAGDCDDDDPDVFPGAAERCNGNDDDCDDVADEDFAVGASCAAGVGACRADGSVACADDGLGTTCSAVPGVPTSERCNDADDDCDGSIDESDADPLRPLEQACYRGTPETRGVGACRDGIAECLAGSFTACHGDVTPAPEVCGDGLDQDCDGVDPSCDADADGVVDDADACPSTTPSAVVDGTGCAIAQLAPCAGPIGGGSWRNHGAYVSAVAHAAEAFLLAGRITEAEKEAIVAAAARSGCGHR